jgi:hypothetical protein
MLITINPPNSDELLVGRYAIKDESSCDAIQKLSLIRADIHPVKVEAFRAERM